MASKIATALFQLVNKRIGLLLITKAENFLHEINPLSSQNSNFKKTNISKLRYGIKI